MVSDRDRAISTVADVSLALVMISAAVVLMGVSLQEEPGTHEPLTADRTAETALGMTVSATYDIYPITGTTADPYDELDWPMSAATYQRSRHGTVATLLAHAAVANATYDGESRTDTAEIFAEAIDGAYRTRIAGADTHAHLTAVWRPYEGSSIEGVATAGPRPPPGADVSTATVTVPSGITLDEDTSYLHGMDHDDRAEELAGALVNYTFPPDGTVHALESSGVRREITLYRYFGFLAVTDDLGDYDHEADDDPLSKGGADPIAVNEDIAEGSDSLADLMDDEQETFASDERFAEWLAIEEVEITVRTWHP